MLDPDVGSTARTGYVVVALRGELDASNAAHTVRKLKAAVAPQLRIIVDLTEVTFMDCSTVHGLVSARAQVQQAGGALLLAGPRPIVRHLLSLLDLIGLLPVFTSVEAAASGIGRPAALACRAAEQAGGGANPGEGAESPAGPRYLAPVGMPGERRSP